MTQWIVTETQLYGRIRLTHDPMIIAESILSDTGIWRGDCASAGQWTSLVALVASLNSRNIAKHGIGYSPDIGGSGLFSRWHNGRVKRPRIIAKLNNGTLGIAFKLGDKELYWYGINPNGIILGNRRL